MRSTGWPTTLSWSMGLRGGGSVEFHAQPFASASTEASVRSTSGTLNALSCVVRAPASSAGRDRLRAARHLALGRLDAPGLVRHAAQRDAARAVALHDRGDGDQREGVRSAVAHLAIEMRAADRLGQRHRRDQLAGLERRSRCAACFPAAGGNRRSGWCAPSRSGRTVSTVASSTRIATAMSLGCVAMQASLTPTMACCRLKPPIAAQPLPGAACCTAGWCRRSRGSACAAAGCRPWSPGCAAGPMRRRPARA